MHVNHTTSTQPAGMTIHPDFMHYVAVNRKEVKAFLKAIAVNAVGPAITLAAVSVKRVLFTPTSQTLWYRWIYSDFQ